METKKILIIDEQGFSRICSALLSSEGYEVQSATVSDVGGALNSRDFGLIVASYPYGAPVFDEVRKNNTPVLILADNFDENLIRMLNNFVSSSCMVKPLDYAKFKLLVKDLMSSELTVTEGYTIV
jgi:DNA-binding response OmpR family regulator